MKTKYHILSGVAALSIAGALCSCSEDYAADLAPETDVVRIASATVGTQSRAAVDANGFANGDEFSLSTSADGTGAATYKLSDGNWTGTLYWSNDDKSDFYAAYPSTATYNSFTLPTDQSSGIEDANYMTAKQEKVQRKAGLNLEFCHKTAKVKIKIMGRSSDGLNDGILAGAVIRSPHSGYTGAAVTGNAVAVTPQTDTAPETGVEVCYTALVIPGEATNFKLFSVNVGGKAVEFTTDIDFEENHVYEYTLTIGEDRLALNSFSVSNWTATPQAGTMDKEWEGEKAEAFAGGDGTKENPYLIANGAQLLHLALDVNEYETKNKYYKLTRDINLAGGNWTPIGLTQNYGFHGHFDGGGHSIKNVKINQSELADQYGTTNIGLFSRILDSDNDVSIRNLTIEDAQITVTSGKNQPYIGILAGDVSVVNYNCIIDNCHIKNAEITVVYGSNVSWSAFVGGIAGQAQTHGANVSFSRCTVEGLNATGNGGITYFGGICGATDGENGTTQFFACSVNGTMQGNYTCGLVGSLWGNNELEVSGSYADCTLTGSNKAACVAYVTSDFSSTMSLSYFAGRGANERYTYDNKPTISESECSIFENPSQVYGIVANPNNPATFTVGGTIYNVKDCWQDNGSELPTLKVSKDGSQQDN